MGWYWEIPLGAAVLMGLSAVICIFGCFFRSTRQDSIKYIILAITLILVSAVCIKPSWTVRKFTFERLAERSEKVVSAIKKYESDNGKPPESLYSLIPKYLEKYPATGMPAYPEYKYRVFKLEDSDKTLYWYDLGDRLGKPVSGFGKYVEGNPDHAILAITVNKSGDIVDVSADRLPENITNEKFDAAKWGVNQERIEMVNSFISDPSLKYLNFKEAKYYIGEPNGSRILLDTPWELLVECPYGFNFDVFYYWPSERYTDERIEKISNWAYLHE